MREDCSASERGELYNLFREWVTTKYPPAGVLTDTDWEVMADDSTKRYIASHATSSNMKQYLNFSNLLLTVRVTCMMRNRTVVAVQTLKLNCRQQDHYYTLYINFIITIDHALCCVNISDQPYYIQQ